MTNNVKNLRLNLGLSRKGIAEKVGTSQRQIQRIESGKQAAKLHLATAICEVLDKPIDTVFPGAGKALTLLDSETKSSKFIPDAAFEKLREVGIEADIRRYSLKLLLRGHQEPLRFAISANEVDRLFRVVQDEANSDSELSFMVFDSDDLRVAINLRAAMFCQFLWDVDFGVVAPAKDDDAEEDDAEDESEMVEVFFAENREPMLIDAEGENGNDIDDEHNYLNIIFYVLDMGGVSPHERLHVRDLNGESIFMRAGDITLLKVPLRVLDPGEYFDEEEDKES